MNEDQLLARIVSDPKVLAGKPVIKGTRLSLEFILGLLAKGTTAEEILGEYEGLSREDLQACLLFESKSTADEGKPEPEDRYPLRGLPLVYEAPFDPVAEEDREAAAELQRRKGDLHPGAITTSDDFDDPLPDEFWLGRSD